MMALDQLHATQLFHTSMAPQHFNNGMKHDALTALCHAHAWHISCVNGLFLLSPVGQVCVCMRGAG